MRNAERTKVTIGKGKIGAAKQIESQRKKRKYCWRFTKFK